MLVKTGKLIGPALNWAVATAEGKEYQKETEYDGIGLEHEPHEYSTNPSQGHLIIEREGIATRRSKGIWYAMKEADAGNGTTMRWGLMTCLGGERYGPLSYEVRKRQMRFDGPTALIAAMRCWVASKLGEEIDLPEELCARQ